MCGMDEHYFPEERAPKRLPRLTHRGAAAALRAGAARARAPAPVSVSINIVFGMNERSGDLHRAERDDEHEVVVWVEWMVAQAPSEAAPARSEHLANSPSAFKKTLLSAPAAPATVAKSTGLTRLAGARARAHRALHHEPEQRRDGDDKFEVVVAPDGLARVLGHARSPRREGA